MTNIINSVSNIIKPVLDNKKDPLHVGEVMNFWTYLTILDESNRFAEIGLNTTTDTELKKAVQRSWEDCHEQIVEIRKFLQNEGVSLPPTTEPKPKSDPRDVPPGVKMTDDEIANGIVFKLVSAISLCGVGLSQSLRSDVGAMWFKYLNVRLNFSAYYMPIMRKRGWIKIPPYYIPNGFPNK